MNQEKPGNPGITIKAGDTFSMEFPDLSRAKQTTVGKAITSAAQLRELTAAARLGDAVAIAFLFRMAGEMTHACAELSRDSKLSTKVRPVVESTMAVPSVSSSFKSYEAYIEGSYTQYEIGRQKTSALSGSWDYSNPTSRLMAGVLLDMIAQRTSGRIKPKAERSALERICADLPKTRHSNQKKKRLAYKAWLAAFLEFVPALWEQENLTPKIEDVSGLPEFRLAADRRATRMEGTKEAIARFMRKHLIIAR